jgi:hypothetical protein
MEEFNIFDEFKSKLLNIDPVNFCEEYLMLDGEHFSLHGTGYKPFIDIYRYIGLKSLEKDSKPVVLVKGRQVGGTTMALALEMYFMGSRLFGNGKNPPIRIIHAFPSLEMAGRYTKSKMNPMIATSKQTKSLKNGKPISYLESMLDPNTSSKDSLSFKAFAGGSHIWIESTGIDASRIRGLTADIIFFDEVQSTPVNALTNATKILHASKYGNPGKGVQVYFGTPLKKGSGFHNLWKESNQQYYHLGCKKCKKHFPLYTPESDEWENIWIEKFDVKCTHCGEVQNKLEAAERGKWVETKPLSECKYIGFHINQLFSPNIPKENVIEEKPENHPMNTERVYRNEVLGEFHQGDSTPISPDELMEKCGDIDRGTSERILSSENKLVFIGIDYGLKGDLDQQANPEKKIQGQSYTTAVVISVEGAGLVKVEFVKKFKKSDPETKRQTIDQLVRQFSTNLIVGDIGYSQDFSTDLSKVYGDKYIVSMASGEIKTPGRVKYHPEFIPKQISFDKNFYIAEMIDKFKAGKIRFPYKDYEKIAWLIEHCCSMEMKPKMSRGGDHTTSYVKGSSPNDGFMALINAYLGYKFYISNGFADTNAFVDNKPKSKNIPAILGHISRRML